MNTHGINVVDLLHVIKHEQKKAMDKLNTVNILIAGNTGVGKSTLINTVFGKRIAETGFGKPITQQISKHTTADLPLAIFDTKGFEVEDGNKIIDDLQKQILSLRDTTVVQDQIHVVWLCIHAQSNRIEKAHENLIALCKNHNIPCIVVLTQSIGGKQFIEKSKEIVIPLGAKAVVPVMAEPYEIDEENIVGVKNLDKLVDETMHVLPQSVEAAFEYCQIADLNRKVKKAKEAIKWAVIGAVGTAPIPIPFGHSAAVITIQGIMIVKINHALGLQLTEDEGKEIVLGVIGILASTIAGQAIFSELIKLIPGAGTVAGSIVGGSVAGTITSMLGNLYLDVVSESVSKTQKLPKTDELIGALKSTFNSKKDYYKNLGKKDADGTKEPEVS